jgi:hypothetical protein
MINIGEFCFNRNMKKIPSLSSWAKALGLCLVMTPVVYMVIFSAYLLVLFIASVIGTASFATNNTNYISKLSAIAGIWLIVLLTIVIPVYLLGLINQFFWGKPPTGKSKLVLSKKSITEGLWQWAIYIVALPFSFTLLILLNDEQMLTSRLTEKQAGMATIFQLIVTACFYEARDKYDLQDPQKSDLSKN